MKRLLVLVLIQLYCNVSNAQIPKLDYSNFEQVFIEDFDDTNFAYRYTATGVDTIWDLKNENWHVGTEYYTKDNLKMIYPSVVSLFETKVNPPYYIGNRLVEYHAGYMRLRPDFSSFTRNYAYGIIEMKVKFPKMINPSDHSTTAPVSFWLFDNDKNEVDVFDISFERTISSRVFDRTYTPSHYVSKDVSIAPTPSLSDSFHTCSVLWTPSIVRFFIDSVEISSVDYKTVRTYPVFYYLETAIMPYRSTELSGQFMHIDWVKIWKMKCQENDLNIDFPTTFQQNPNHPFFDATPKLGRLFSYHHVNITSQQTLQLLQDVPTIIEAESTEIDGIFLADQSTLTTRQPPTPPPGGGTYAPENSNGFLEIIAVQCNSFNNPYKKNWPDPSKKNTGTSSSENSKHHNIENSQDNLLIYPNPTNGIFTIRLPDTGEYAIQITNTIGAVIYKAEIANVESQSIRLGKNIYPGVYTIMVSGSKKKYYKRITIVQ